MPVDVAKWGWPSDATAALVLAFFLGMTAFFWVLGTRVANKSNGRHAVSDEAVEAIKRQNALLEDNNQRFATTEAEVKRMAKSLDTMAEDVRTLTGAVREMHQFARVYERVWEKTGGKS